MKGQGGGRSVAFYVLALVWMGAVLFSAGEFFVTRQRAAFRREGRRFVDLWAARVGEAAERQGAPSLEGVSLSRWVSRLAGEADSRFAVLTDNDRRVLFRRGDPVDGPVLSSPSEPADQQRDQSLWVFQAPVWVQGRRAGFLMWGRDTAFLEEEKRYIQRGLATAWAWGALAGALGIFLAEFKKRRER